MVRVKVDIQSVSHLKDTIGLEIDALQDLKRSTTCIPEILNRIREESAKILETLPVCHEAQQNGQDKLQKLQEELAELEDELARTPPTITVTESDGVDSEGNPRYTTRTVPNPDYTALLEEIQALRAKVNLLRTLLEQLSSEIENLQMTMETFKNASITISEGSAEIHTTSESLIRKSEHATEQLGRAIVAITDYMEETVNLNPVPNRSAINWQNYYTFSSLLDQQSRMNMPITTWDDNRGDSVFCGIRGKHYAESQTILISKQGQADKEYQGTCGITSVANVLRQLGVMDATEKDVLEMALKHGVCRTKEEMEKRFELGLCKKREDVVAESGGTTNSSLLTLMHSYGLKAAKVPEMTIQNIVDCLEKGGTMMMSVRSKYIKEPYMHEGKEGKKIPTKITSKRLKDHWVTVTGIEKNRYTGEISGIFIQDTGGHNSSSNLFIPVEQFKRMRKITKDFTGIATFK